MLKRLYIHNYKCLVDFELELGPLNVFVGENGSGKSAALKLFDDFVRCIRGEYKLSDFVHYGNLTNWLDEKIVRVEFDVSLKGREYHFKFEITVGQYTGTRITAESISETHWDSYNRSEDGRFKFWGGDDAPKILDGVANGRLGMAAYFNELREHDRTKEVMQWLKETAMFAFNPGGVENSTSGNYADLYRTGENFPTWYFANSYDHRSLNDAFLADLREVVAGSREFRLERMGNNIVDRVPKFFFESAKPSRGVHFNDLSDGQRALTFHYAVMHFLMKDGNFVAFDEPDNFVALREIQPWLSEVSDRCYAGDAQSVIISHHPEVIDFLGRENGIFFWRDESGATRAKRLEECVDEKMTLSLSEQMARGWIEPKAV